MIAHDGAPVARIVAVPKPFGTPQFGRWKGRIELGDSFWDPLPPEELAAWEGAYKGPDAEPAREE